MALNILYLHETAKISGAENSLLSLAGGLDRDGFTPFFILPGEGPLLDVLRRSGAGCGIVPMPPIRRIFGVSRPVAMIHDFIRDNKIDLIHANSIRTNLYASIVGRKARIPVVWHERNLITNELVDPDRLLSFLPDRIICNSHAIARRFSSFGRLPAKVRVVHNGVNTQRFSPSADGGKFRKSFGMADSDIVIGITSRFGRDKGHETYLDAAKKVIGDLGGIGERIKFLVVGSAVFEDDAWREEYVRGYAKRLGISANVVFTGMVEDMPAAYAAMDALVLASWAEPCGRVIFEAMASARPVIGTNAGGTPEIVDDGVTGILFSPKDVSGLTAAIEELILNEDKRKEMGILSRKRIEENFTIAAHVSKTQGIYSELIVT